MRTEFQKWYELYAKLEVIALGLRTWEDQIDREEANNGDTEQLDIMIHHMHWFLADSMADILHEAARLEGVEKL